MPDAPSSAPPLGVPLGSERARFAVPDDVVYVNTASLGPMLRTALDAGHAALERRAAPWTIHEDDWFAPSERVRQLLAALVGAPDADGVALVPATSYGMAVAAAILPVRADDEIVVLAEEYPSGVLTWRRVARETGARVVTVARSAGQSWGSAVVAAIGERTAIVSAPQVHWTDGALVDLDAVAARCRQVGARLVVDASQSLGAMPLDVTALRPDVVVSVGYKWLLGPYGRSYAWVAPDLRDGRPIEDTWLTRAGADDFASLVEYRDEYQPGARRYDQGGRPLLELTPIAVAALEQLTAWGVPSVAAALAQVSGEIVARLEGLGLAPSAGPDDRGPHIVGVPVPPDARDRVLASLERAGCYAALRGTSLRISPHLHVTPSDVDRLVAAVADAL
jgi:selenocysteine lyase/cysteine desulfurase